MNDQKTHGAFNPTPDQLSEILDGVAKGRTVIVSGITEVNYSGRASSKATKAWRLLILKPDGSMILHSGRNNRPVNWQPPGTEIKAMFVGNDFVVEGTRKTPKEILSVKFSEVSIIAYMPLTDGNDDFEIVGTEREMVSYVNTNPGVIESGFAPLECEAKTDYGNADMIGRLKSGELLVLEFKRATAQLSSVSQVQRYVSYFAAKEAKVVGGVVAPGITKPAQKMLDQLKYRFYKLEPIVEKREKSVQCLK